MYGSARQGQNSDKFTYEVSNEGKIHPVFVYEFRYIYPLFVTYGFMKRN